MARPSKLTSATAEAICQRLRSGVPRVHAAESLGVDRRTMFLWLRLGREAERCGLSDCAGEHHGPLAVAVDDARAATYLQFLHMVTQAEAEAVVLVVSYVQKAAQHDPANARWWLERRCPADFGRNARVEVTGSTEQPLETTVRARERLMAEIEKIEARMREQNVLEQSTPGVSGPV